MSVDISFIIAGVSVLIAIWGFFERFKKSAKDDGLVDTDQNIKIAKVETRIDDLEKRVVENKNDMIKELGKIEDGMKEMRILLNQILVFHLLYQKYLWLLYEFHKVLFPCQYIVNLAPEIYMLLYPP